MVRFGTRKEEILSRLPPFHGLDEIAIKRLAAAAVCEEKPRGSVLYRRGDPSQGVHIIVSGVVKLVVHTNRGDEKVVGLLQPGRSFGEAVMFAGKGHLVSAETVVDTKLVYLKKEAINEELDLNPQLARNIIEYLSNRLYQRIEDLERYTLLSGTERVIAFLLTEYSGDDTSVVKLPFKKGIIASRLNLTQEHFSRILRSLSKTGLIEVHGSEVRIPDLARLRATMPDYEPQLA